MGWALSDRAARKLNLLLQRTPDPDPNRPGRGGSIGRLPLIVRCTSETAAGGSDIGDQCYPAVIVAADGDTDTQPELGDVWLTVLGDNASPGTPSEDALYYGMLSGNFDDGTDDLPRVFAVDIPAPGTITVKEVDGSPSVSSVSEIRFDQVDGFVITNPSAGVVRVDMVPATTTQNGVVSTSAQYWQGEKYIDDANTLGVVDAASPTDYILMGVWSAHSLTAHGINRQNSCILQWDGGNNRLVLSNTSINAMKYAVWDGSAIQNGASGSFTTNDGKTVTVVGGIITSIV